MNSVVVGTRHRVPCNTVKCWSCVYLCCRDWLQLVLGRNR